MDEDDKIKLKLTELAVQLRVAYIQSSGYNHPADFLKKHTDDEVIRIFNSVKIERPEND